MCKDDETIAEFLESLGQELKSREGEDVELAEILIEHILTPSPADDCTDKAMQVIKSLAESRATLPEGESDAQQSLQT